MHAGRADRKHTRLCLPGRAFLFEVGDMDQIQRSAVAFRRLLDYQYIIRLGRKNVLYEFVLDFDRDDFLHLIGLHKMRDLRELKRSAASIFVDCLKGKITDKMLMKSEFFDELGSRFADFDQLEAILDDNRSVFRCNLHTMQAYSTIIADYLLQTEHHDKTFYLFTERRHGGNRQFCKSFFEKGKTDYANGQMRLTLLYKEKVNKRTGERQVQYQKLSEKVPI